MNTLDIRTVYLDAQQKILGANRDFSIAFEVVGHTLVSLEEIVDPQQADDLAHFIKSNGNSGSVQIFRLRGYDNNYRYNFVTVNHAVYQDHEAYEVRLMDVNTIYENYQIILGEQNMLRAALSQTNEYFFYYHLDSNILKVFHFIQNRMEKLCEQDIDEWKQDALVHGVVPKEQASALEDMVQEIKHCPETISASLTCALRTGSSVMEQLHFNGCRYNTANELYIVGTIMTEQDYQVMSQSSDFLEEFQLDSLTKVYNKKTVTAYAMKKFKEKPDTARRTALVIMDLDHFKPVNDRYGHLEGDKVLAQTGNILKGIVGDNGMVGRYGGDEFLLVLNGMDTEQILRGTLNNILACISKAFEHSFEDIKITTSIGAAVFPDNGTTFDELFKKADFGLYRAKDKGRNRYVFFRDDLHAELYKKAIADKSAGIKYDERDIQEVRYMSEFLQRFQKNPIEATKSVLEHMQQTYGLSCINLYCGKGYKRVFCVGQSSDLLKEAPYVNSPDFIQALNGENNLVMDYPGGVPEYVVPFKDVLLKRGVKSTIQMLLQKGNDVFGLITYDRLKAPAMWAEYEKNCALLVGSILSMYPDVVEDLGK